MSETLRLNSFIELNYHELLSVDGGDAFLAWVCGIVTVCAIVVAVACPPASATVGAIAWTCVKIGVTGGFATYEASKL